MIDAQSWHKLQKAVGLGCLALTGIGFAKFFGLGILGVGAAVYVTYEAYAALKQDEADERNELIAMRAAYLSHKLTISLGFVLLLALKPPSLVPLAIVCVAVLSEAAFRKLQGTAPHPHAAPVWAWWLTILALLAFVAVLLSMLMELSGNPLTMSAPSLWRLIAGR